MKAPMRLAVLLLFASLSALAADLTLTMTSTGKGNEGEQTQYWSSKFMRTNHGTSQVDSMVDFEKGISYTINHKKKLIQFISWDDMEAAMESLAEKMKDLPPFVQKMMGGGDTTVTVEEQGMETILDRKCKKWKITMGKMIIESSNDPSLKPPMPAVAFKRFLKLKNTMGQVTGNVEGMTKLGEALAKVQGIALRTHTVMPIVGDLSSVATLVKEGPIPAATFGLPEGYKMEDSGKKMRESADKGR